MDENIELFWTPIFTDSCGTTIEFVADDTGHFVDLGCKVEPVVGVANDYALSTNKPKINGVELAGNKTTEELHIKALTNMEIEAIINSFV